MLSRLLCDKHLGTYPKKKEKKTEILRKLMESGTNMKIITITALKINIIPLLVTMSRKIKKPLVRLNFWQSQ